MGSKTSETKSWQAGSGLGHRNGPVQVGGTEKMRGTAARAGRERRYQGGNMETEDRKNSWHLPKMKRRISDYIH